jgi:hypothetical protein
MLFVDREREREKEINERKREGKKEGERENARERNERERERTRERERERQPSSLTRCHITDIFTCFSVWLRPQAIQRYIDFFLLT